MFWSFLGTDRVGPDRGCLLLSFAGQFLRDEALQSHGVLDLSVVGLGWAMPRRHLRQGQTIFLRSRDLFRR